MAIGDMQRRTTRLLGRAVLVAIASLMAPPVPLAAQEPIQPRLGFAPEPTAKDNTAPASSPDRPVHQTSCKFGESGPAALPPPPCDDIDCCPPSAVDDSLLSYSHGCCYEPRWRAVANAAFFAQGAHPVTQTRLRWEAGFNTVLPDRSEYLIARADGSPVAQGPKPRPPAAAIRRLNYHDLRWYTEAAVDRFSISIDIPYRSIDSDFTRHGAGLGDLVVGFKALLLDTEVAEIAVALRGYIPTGNADRGLGTAHASLEPALLFALKLYPEAFLQGEIAEWIPIDGDEDYAGAILHYHFSANHRVAYFGPATSLIATLEFSGFSFQDGAYTDPALGPLQPSSGSTYFYAGTGLRLDICNRTDLGVAVQVPLTDVHFAEVWLRTDLRIRF